MFHGIRRFFSQKAKQQPTEVKVGTSVVIRVSGSEKLPFLFVNEIIDHGVYRLSNGMNLYHHFGHDLWLYGETPWSGGGRSVGVEFYDIAKADLSGFEKAWREKTAVERAAAADTLIANTNTKIVMNLNAASAPEG